MSERRHVMINGDKSPEPVPVVQVTAPAGCEECGDARELRPYGKNGTNVCFDCMMKDEAEGERQMKKAFGWSND